MRNCVSYYILTKLLAFSNCSWIFARATSDYLEKPNFIFILSACRHGSQWWRPSNPRATPFEYPSLFLRLTTVRSHAYRYHQNRDHTYFYSDHTFIRCWRGQPFFWGRTGGNQQDHVHPASELQQFLLFVVSHTPRYNYFLCCFLASRIISLLFHSQVTI